MAFASARLRPAPPAMGGIAIVEWSQGVNFSILAPSATRYSLYFWLMKSNIASAVGNFTDWAISRILSLGMPALTIALDILSWVSVKALISGSAISIAKRESLVISFCISSMVFLFFKNASTMLVPAEPSPINCTLFWYIFVLFTSQLSS